MSLKNYKILSYILLVLTAVISVAVTNLLINLIISGKLGQFAIIYVIINLLINFTMFFLLFRAMHLLLEKDTELRETIKRAQASKEEKEDNTVTEELKKIDIEELIKQIVPSSPQSLGMEKFAETVLSNIAKVSELVQGVFYLKNKENSEFRPVGKYAYFSNQQPKSFIEGETLPGQVAKDKKMLNINNIPSDYFTVVSGLGSSSPRNLLIVPVLDKEGTTAVMELATFKAYDKNFEQLFEKLAVLLGKIINKIK